MIRRNQRLLARPRSVWAVPRWALVRLWAAPWTFVGLLVGFAGGRLPMIQDGVFRFECIRGPVAALMRWRGTKATALGHAVVAQGWPMTPHIWHHELVHVRQAEKLGPAYLPWYMLLYLKHGYDNHPMELEAYGR